MGLTTEKITYNVHDRGRRHRGVDRLFDTVALAALLNSEETQERVRKGDLQGYYGHWPRVVFGMPTQEGGIMDGKAVELPVAVKTVFLSADQEGNITHQVQFLDTAAGQIAERLYLSKTGGFSSAIVPERNSSPTVPKSIEGWDYVLEPNYDTNRGYRGKLLDAVGQDSEEFEEAMALLDGVDQSFAATKHLNGMLDAALAQGKEQLEALASMQDEMARLRRENDLLIGRLAAPVTRVEGDGVLDSIVGTGGAIAPVRGGATPDQFRAFKALPLAELQKMDDDQPAGESPDIDFVNRRYGTAF